MSWRELLVNKPRVFSEQKLASVRRQVLEAQVALSCGLADYFLNRLAPPDTVRVLPHFSEAVAYLDVETTGLGAKDPITVISLHGPKGTHSFIRGRNLVDFLRELKGLALLVSYNGSAFDLPRIRREFGINLSTPHLDLKPCLQALGYKGGLKECERLIGIQRHPAQAITGQDAARLWLQYEVLKDETALLELLRYNLRDAMTLELLAVEVYNRVMGSYPMRIRLPRPKQAAVEEWVLPGAS